MPRADDAAGGHGRPPHHRCYHRHHVDAASTIIVMGVTGGGKTTLGRLLASAIGARFLEGDDFHPESNLRKMKAGIALEDSDRWPWLDAIAAGIEKSLNESSAVVASCSALKRGYRDRFRARLQRPILFVCLNPPRRTLEDRLHARTGHFMAPSLLTSQLDTLELPGPDENAIVLSSGDPAESQVAAVLQRRAHDLKTLPP